MRQPAGSQVVSSRAAVPDLSWSGGGRQPSGRASIHLMVQDWIANRNMRAFTFQDAHDPLRQVDLLLAAAVPFDEIIGSAEILQAFGVQVPVANIDMLIRMKSGTGRAQDVSDVEALTRVREARRGGD